MEKETDRTVLTATESVLSQNRLTSPALVKERGPVDPACLGPSPNLGKGKSNGKQNTVLWWELKWRKGNRILTVRYSPSASAPPMEYEYGPSQNSRVTAPGGKGHQPWNPDGHMRKHLKGRPSPCILCCSPIRNLGEARRLKAPQTAHLLNVPTRSSISPCGPASPWPCDPGNPSE